MTSSTTEIKIAMSKALFSKVGAGNVSKLVINIWKHCCQTEIVADGEFIKECLDLCPPKTFFRKVSLVYQTATRGTEEKRKYLKHTHSENTPNSLITQ